MHPGKYQLQQLELVKAHVIRAVAISERTVVTAIFKNVVCQLNEVV